MKPCLLLPAALLLTNLGLPSQAAPPLVAEKPIALSGAKGRFDFITVDATRRRLLAAHTGNNSLDIIDLDKQTLLASAPTGAAQGEAIDAQAGKYLASVSKPPQMAVVDAETFQVTGKVALSGEADVMTFNPKTGRAYVCHDEAKEIWVIDPSKLEIVATINLPSAAPEDLAFDTSGQRLFQNLKNANAVAVIDPETNKITASWPTAPAQSPHGMAMVDESNALLDVGGNGKLVLMSLKDGSILSSVSVASRIDQLAYDPGLHRAYGASGTGKISVVQLEGNNLAAVGDVDSAEGAHSIAVDPKTHTVWIAYAKGDASYVQPFTPAK